MERISKLFTRVQITKTSQKMLHEYRSWGIISPVGGGETCEIRLEIERVDEELGCHNIPQLLCLNASNN
eukprot:5907004-Ditylum_brightwellii.AAC.1